MQLRNTIQGRAGGGQRALDLAQLLLKLLKLAGGDLLLQIHDLGHRLDLLDLFRALLAWPAPHTHTGHPRSA